MACQCGSQKKSTAPDTINPVNIGNLCFLFGVEGALCGFLDLIPTTINSILKVNNKPEDADKIFWKWIARFAKTGYNIVIDEATGDIDLSSFCSNPPPPLPEEITFSDIFIFMAKVVLILDYWFTANDILSGNSTRLIDKVAAYWLFKQWYENCECKRCPPPPILEDPINEPPLFDPPACPCPDASGSTARCKELVLKKWDTSQSAISSCHGFYKYSVVTELGAAEFPTDIFEYARRIEEYWIPLEVSVTAFLANRSLGIIGAFRQNLKTVGQSLLTQDITTVTDDNVLYAVETRKTDGTSVLEGYYKNVISGRGGNFVPFSGNTDGFLYPPCPACQEPTPPPEFCDLYPNHPNCTQDQNEDCETELVLVGDFTQCNQLRSPKRLDLIVNGDLYDVAVTEKLTCESIRSLKTVQYLECSAVAPPPPPPPPPPSNCDNVDCLASLDAARYALEEAHNNGYSFSDEYDARNYLLNSGTPLDYECCDSWITDGINEFFYNTQGQ